MARRRFQTGSIKPVGKKVKKWQLRYREDVIRNGERVRIERTCIIGTLAKYPTKKLALREAAERLEKINDVRYRPPVEGTFAKFAERWMRDVLSQKKFSTQATERSRINNHLLPAFGDLEVSEIGPEIVQAFVGGWEHNVKSLRNCIATLRMMWNSARAWKYTSIDWFEELALPEYVRPESPHFTLEEMQQIIKGATGPHRAFYWLASETGMRLGELCALKVGSLHLNIGVISVRYSAWHGKVGSTKSKRPRVFRLSPQLAALLSEQIQPVAGDPDAFVFRTKNGTPWIGDDVVKDNLKPLLIRLRIKTIEDGRDDEGNTKYRVMEGVGMHAFRHGNASVMDSEHIPLKVRQDRLGHVDGEELTLGTYTHAESDDHAAVAQKLGDLLAPEPIVVKNRLADMKPISRRAM